MCSCELYLCVMVTYQPWLCQCITLDCSASDVHLSVNGSPEFINNLLTTLDDSHILLLSLLGLSAAFDIIDHETLLSCLHHAFGMSDTALSWFWCYLFEHTQVVSVKGISSSPSVFEFGVPQGSVLGPILFVFYIQQLSDIVHHHFLSRHSFSDDEQLYKSGHILQLQDIIQSTQ